MKNLSIVCVLLLVLSMAIFAGGQQGEDAATAADFNIDAPAEPTTIDVIGWAFPITEFYAEKFEELNAIDNLEVNTQLLDSASAQEQVRLALSGGKKSPYEVIHAANSQIPEWNEWVIPLNDLVEKYWDEYDLGDIPQNAWDAATVDGKIIGVPMVANSLHLYYRADLLEKHGIDVPETYDEVIAAAKMLDQKENSIDVAFTMNLHAGWAWEIEFLHFLRSFGGDYLNDDNTPGFAGPEGVKALAKMVEVAEGAMGQAGMAYSIDDSQIGLQTGRLAMANMWTSRAVGMNDPDTTEFYEDIKHAPAPRPNPNGARGGSSWNDFYLIPETTDVDKELIFKTIMEVVKLENQIEATEYGVPTRIKALNQAEAEYMAAAGGSLEEGVGAYTINPGLPLVRQVLGEYLPLAMTGEDPASVLQKAYDAYMEEARANGFVD